jgi:hypothetical protein
MLKCSGLWVVRCLALILHFKVYETEQVLIEIAIVRL